MNKALLLLLSIFLFSCGKDYPDYSGNWIDKQTELNRLSITQNGKTFLVNYNEKKYPSKIIDGLLEISFSKPQTASLDIENNILIMNGKEYILSKNGKRKKFDGLWKQKYFIEDGKEIKSDDSQKIALRFAFDEKGKTYVHEYDKQKPYGKMLPITKFKDGIISSDFKGIDPHLLEPITVTTTYEIQDNGLLKEDRGYDRIAYFEKTEDK